MLSLICRNLSFRKRFIIWSAESVRALYLGQNTDSAQKKTPILFEQDTVPLSLPFSWGGDLDPSSITQFINSGQHIVNCFLYQFALREESYWGTFPSFKEDTLAVTSCITINVSPCFFQLLSKLAALRKHFQKKSNWCAFLVFFYARLYKGIKCDFIWKDTLNYYILGFFCLGVFHLFTCTQSRQ